MVALPRLANDEFKAHHAGYLRRALLAAVVLHILLFALSPPFTFKPYRLPEAPVFVVIDDVPEIKIPDPPADIAPPRVEIGKVDPGEQDVEIPVNLLEFFRDNPIAVKDPTHVPDFVAFDELPVLIEFSPPEYPDLARQAGIEGTVHVKVVVGKDGKVLSATVESSDVTRAMERSARDAALRSRFDPARQRNKPVTATVLIPYRFRLGR